MPNDLDPRAGQQPTQPDLEYAGFWARVAAALIDTVMLLIVTMPLTYLAYGRFSNGESALPQGALDIVINWLLPAAIILWLWNKLQATPGKMAISARIVDADTGQAPTLTQFLIRYVGYFVSTLPLCLGLFWVGIDARKQGWHDKMARTVVVRPRRKTAVSFEKGAE